MGQPKACWLGTALWGWGIDEAAACALLDGFAEAGGEVVDAATNYPINKNAQDFGVANEYLAAWLKSNPETNLRVFCKLGARDNLGSPLTDLSPSFVLTTVELLRSKFGSHLTGVGIHWDNRESERDIAETLEVFRSLLAEGLQIGLSGVRRPDLYAAAAPDLSSHWWIQVKENALTSEARQTYTPFFTDASYMAYGTNMGGLKSDANRSSSSSLALRGIELPDIAEKLTHTLEQWPDDVTPRPTNFVELALFLTHSNDGLVGMIAGPRDVQQLESTLSTWQRLNAAGSDPEWASRVRDVFRATLA